jgi:DNA N-6-adenine-methyltransferase (Dam)
MRDLVAPHDAQLEPIEYAKELIARAVWEQDSAALVELRGRASAFELYHRRAGARDLANDAGEIKVRAEAGLGAIDRQLAPHGVKQEFRPPGTLDPPLEDVHHDTRAAWRKVSTIDDDTLAGYLAQIRANENAAISTATVIGIARLGGTLASTTFECYTPAQYVEAAREVLGMIDLDPASSAEANKTIKAARYYHAEDDGLGHDWHGRVWLNPPYGRKHHAAFAEHLVAQHQVGNVTAAIILLNAYGFDAAWFQPLWRGELCFTDHRIKFYGGGPTFGSLFVYLGPDRVRFDRIFSRFGTVVRQVAA